MQLQLWKCDQCSKEFRLRGGVSIDLPLDTFTPDPAGGRSDRDSKQKDLCTDCATAMIAYLASLCLMSGDKDTKGKYLRAAHGSL